MRSADVEVMYIRTHT